MTIKFPIPVYDNISEISSRKELDELIDDIFSTDEVLDLIVPTDFGCSDLVRVLEDAGYDITGIVDTLIEYIVEGRGCVKPSDDTNEWYIGPFNIDRGYTMNNSDG